MYKKEEMEMNFWEFFMIAVGLSMDAFAVAICKGLSLPKMNWKYAVITGIYFGGFQAGMPFFGYLLGANFQEMIRSIDHWIAFILLVIIGGNMIKESRKEVEKMDSSFGIRAMLPLAVATSIDALAVGVGFAFLQVDILPAVCFIGVVTFLFSFFGIQIGNLFGTRYKARAEIVGGIILILMGGKILLEHLGILG